MIMSLTIIMAEHNAHVIFLSVLCVFSANSAVKEEKRNFIFQKYLNYKRYNFTYYVLRITYSK